MKPSAEARTPPLFRTTFVKRVKCAGSAVHFLVTDAAMTGAVLCGTAPTTDERGKKPIWRWVRTVEPGLCQTCLSIACVERMRVVEKA